MLDYTEQIDLDHRGDGHRFGMGILDNGDFFPVRENRNQ
jgi:hypothetical protein